MSNHRRNHIVGPNDPPKGPSLFLRIIQLLVFLPAGIFFLIKRGLSIINRHQLRAFRHYAAIIGDRSSVSIREIATRLGKSTDEVISDLQTMIDRGIIDPRAYIDRKALLLYMPDDVIETDFVSNADSTRQARPVATAIPVEVTPAKAQSAKPAAPKVDLKKAAQPQPTETPKRKTPAPRKTGMENEDFEAKLREIRQLNEDIDNELVSQRIDRIGALTASIFRVVREKPERADEVRKFMNYYLPTTLKLLKSYSLMEKQSYQGKNIAASRKKIEDVLETLVHAFEQQQDKLFQSDALDLETDISVLETMMASDGLTEQSRGLHL